MSRVQSVGSAHARSGGCGAGRIAAENGNSDDNDLPALIEEEDVSAASSDDDLPPLVSGSKVAPSAFGQRGRPGHGANRGGEDDDMPPLVSESADVEDHDLPPLVSESAPYSDDDELPPLLDESPRAQLSRSDPVIAARPFGTLSSHAVKPGAVAAMSDDDDNSLPPMVDDGNDAAAQDESGDDLPPLTSSTPAREDSDDDLPALVSSGASPRGGKAKIAGPSLGSRARDFARGHINGEGPATYKAPIPARPSNSAKVSSEPQEGAPDEFAEARSELKQAKLELVRCRRSGDRWGEAETLLSMVELQLAHNMLEEALNGALEVRKLYKELGDGVKEAGALRTVMRVHLAADKPEEALHMAREGLSLFRKVGNRGGEAILQLGLADVHLSRDAPEEALQEATQALAQLREATDKQGIAAALQVLIGTNSALERHGEVTKLATEALALLQDSGDTKAEAEVQLRLSTAHLARGNPDDALRAAKSSIALCRDTGDTKGEGAAMNAEASAHLAMPDSVEAALRAATLASGICKEQGDKFGEVAAWRSVASSYLATEAVDDALHASHVALKKARELGDVSEIGKTVEMIMNIHQRSESSDKKVEEVAEQELQLARESSDRKRQACVLHKLARALSSLERPKEGLRRIRQAVVVLRELGDKRAEASALLTTSDLHAADKQRPEALKSAQDALALFRELGDTRGVVSTLQHITSFHVEGNEPNLGLEAAIEQRQAYRKVGWLEEEAMTMLGLAEFVAQLPGNKGGVRPAFKFAKEAQSVHRHLGNKKGEADSLLLAAGYLLQMNSRNDALRTSKEAQALFREVGDHGGQARSLHNICNTYLTVGNMVEAVRAANEAQDVCRKAGDMAAEGRALLVTFEVHTNIAKMQRDEKRRPAARTVKDALAAAEAAVQLFRKLGDQERHDKAAALRAVSTARLLDKDVDGALQAARESTDIAVELDEALPMASALLSTAEVQLAMRSHAEAQQLAQEAQDLFQQCGDEPGLEHVGQVLAQIEEEMAPKENSRPKLSGSSGGAGHWNCEGVQAHGCKPGVFSFDFRRGTEEQETTPGEGGRVGSQAVGFTQRQMAFNPLARTARSGDDASAKAEEEILLERGTRPGIRSLGLSRGEVGMRTLGQVRGVEGLD